jgi:hypothetical protein
MSRTEEDVLRRISGLKIVIWSLVFGVAGVAPIYLYMAFGPKDGNPIGLGLLAVFALPVGGIGVVVGLVIMLVQYFKRRKE